MNINKTSLLLIDLGRQFGGVEKVCENLLVNMEDKYDCFVLCIKNTLFHTHIKKYTDNILLLPSNKFLFPVYFLLTIYYLIRYRIKIIHCHGVFSSFVGTVSGFLLRKRIVTTIHGVVTVERGDSIKAKIFTWLENTLFHFNHKYICVSYYLKNELEKRIGKSNKIEVIYNSINTTKEIKTTEKADGTIGISSVGRLEPIKGHIYLIKAVEKLVNEGYEIQCLIAGEGSQRELYEKYIRENNLENNVKLIGFVDGVTEFIASTTIFVNPSLIETFGLSVAEAMSVGMPIIATDVGALSELIENEINGYLIPKEDDNELYLKLKELINNKDKRTMFSKRAKERFNHSFSQNRMVEQYSKVYNMQ